VAIASRVREQDRTLEREHSIYGFRKQVNLVERTWNDDLHAMSYGLGIAIVAHPQADLRWRVKNPRAQTIAHTMRQETAALRDFQSIYVRFGSSTAEAVGTTRPVHVRFAPKATVSDQNVI
jgi:hypothetical protein